MLNYFNEIDNNHIIIIGKTYGYYTHSGMSGFTRKSLSYKYVMRSLNKIIKDGKDKI